SHHPPPAPPPSPTRRSSDLPASWAELFERHAPNRWRRAELTVNYRTPAEIMEVATAVLASAAPGVVPPRSMREEGVAPWAVQTRSEEHTSELQSHLNLVCRL